MRTTLFLISATVCLANSPGAWGQKVDVLKATTALSWPGSMAGIPLANRMSSGEVTGFLNSFQTEEAEPPLRIEEFRFARLERGRIALVATVDVSGRGLFYGMLIVWPEGSKFRRTILASAPPHLLASELVDLDGDGLDEIITKEEIGGYRGARTDQIFWYTIWRLQGGKIEDVSSKFPEFYERCVLPELIYFSNTIAVAGHKGPDATALQQAEIEFARLKFTRKILGEPDAGFPQAVGWSRSADAELQELAIRTFEEIPGSQSLRELEELANSSNSSISEAAKNALARLQQRNKK